MDSPVPSAAVLTAEKVERAGDRGVFLIAIFELVKTVLFLIAAAGVFHLVAHDTQFELKRLLHVFRVSGDSAFIKGLLLKANVITDPTKRILGGLLLLYAALHATEGIGLLLRKRWAEYFTVIMTGIPLLLEIYLIVHRTTHSGADGSEPPEQHLPVLFGQHIFLWKIVGLVANLGILVFLIYHLRRGGGHGRQKAEGRG